jgi:large subunit ribosomal protein L25
MAAQARDRVGKGTARAARRNGMVPCVIYGNKKPAVSVLLERRIVERELHKGGFTNRLYDVDVEGKSEQVLPRDVQLHPITDLPMHVDFLRLSSATQIKIMVPVTFLDDEESPGLKRGGVLNVVRHEIEFSCRADAIPETIEISLDGLDIGDSIHISQVKLPDGVEPTITDRDFTIATIAAPTVATEEEEAEAAEGEAEGEAAEGEGEAAEGEASAEESGGEE